ncbi:MAG: patatin-like phospholipase family protein [Fibrobacter sp.]|nr:patatin-like phospholipase family protein [Fibrobacter sp.]
MKLVISVSGGGALGIGPLQFMKRLEDDLKKNLGDWSAAFAGTSTGSIIASGLCNGMSAAELYDVYKKGLPSIFKKNTAAIIKKNYVQYKNDGLKKLLYEYFPGKLDKFKKPIYIPTTYMNGESVEKVWDRTDSWMDRAYAVLTSCSAPTYFDLAKIDGKVFCDGGMWANDPIMVLESAIETKKECKSIRDAGYKILSFNTGMLVPNKEPKSTNAVGWLTYIMDNWIARTGNSNLFEAQANLGKDNIFRCEPSVTKPYAMDDLDVVDEVSNIWDEYYTSVRTKVLKFVKSTK